MLIELRIKDYAVIHDLTLELGSGLSALSGETGAGKSIIVGALSLLLGERAASDTVRTGAERAMVEAVFDVATYPKLGVQLDDLGIEAEDGLLILRREVAAVGRNRAWINESPTTARTVGELGRSLVDLHGQHEHQTLLRKDTQRHILDAFGEAEEDASAVEEAYEELGGLEAKLRELQDHRRELASRVDFLRFQMRELEEADVQSGEEEALTEESGRLENSEELLGETTRIHDELYSAEGALTDKVSGLAQTLARLKGWDPALEGPHEELQGAYHALAEVGRDLSDYVGGLRHDPGRLEEVRSRLDLIHSLKRKYGPTSEDVIATRDRVRTKLDEVEDGGWDEDTLAAEVDRTRSDLIAAAARLSEKRQAAVTRLEEEVEALLPDLGLPAGTFKVQMDTLPEVKSRGAESIEFLVSVNAGFPPSSLARVASGGELSRVMLTLKAILAQVDQVPTLVFDEIDAGIGGQVASLVAAKLKDVARYHQVFVVTHLPQLASQACSHLLVEKDEREGLAATAVRGLTGDARVREIARMLGGDPESETSQDHARELLAAGD
ncbi:MAG TPA: DNA repair protein RecN [Gemmatimonadetes bacterium]|nr:DNA repair protein RecN [Gemmatimonadota bacterium]